MHRALLGDLECPGTLLLVERPVQGDLALDPVEQTLLGVAFGAVAGVDPGGAPPHRHAPEGPPPPARPPRERPGRAPPAGSTRTRAETPAREPPRTPRH